MIFGYKAYTGVVPQLTTYDIQYCFFECISLSAVQSFDSNIHDLFIAALCQIIA